MLLGHLPDDGQAQSAPLVAPGSHAPVEPVKYIGQVRRIDPGPVSCRTVTPSASTRTSTTPPGREWRAALSSRLLAEQYEPTKNRA